FSQINRENHHDGPRGLKVTQDSRQHRLHHVLEPSGIQTPPKLANPPPRPAVHSFPMEPIKNRVFGVQSWVWVQMKDKTNPTRFFASACPRTAVSVQQTGRLGQSITSWIHLGA